MKIVLRHPALVTVFASVIASCAVVSTSPAATPVCLSTSSDTDGDGWGWESNRSCIVSNENSTDTPTNPAIDDTESGNNQGSNTTPPCSSAGADPDGDGWGWENNRSCLVTVTTQAATDGDAPDDSSNNPTEDQDTAYSGKHPICSNASFDQDGDGWGYENFRSCIVIDNTDASGDDSADDQGNSQDNNGDSSDPPGNQPAGNKAEDDVGVIYTQNFAAANEGLYQGDQLNAAWNTPIWHLGFDQGRVSIVRDTQGHGKVMRVNYPAGAYGADGASAFLSDVQFGMGLSKSYNELYVSYDLKFADNFEFVKGGKLPGLCGSDINQSPGLGCNTGGGFPSGYDGWSARSMWRLDGAMENYVYHSAQKNFYGDDELWNVKAQPGKWHTIQHRVVMNTSGESNGILEAWFDGIKVLSANDFIYRKADTIGINLFYFSTFFGGNDSSWAPSTDQNILFDNFVISTKPIVE